MKHQFPANPLADVSKECAEYYVSDKEKERAKWVCEICGENTFEVDFDYLGSEYNHLGCELEIEMMHALFMVHSLHS